MNSRPLPGFLASFAAFALSTLVQPSLLLCVLAVGPRGTVQPRPTHEQAANTQLHTDIGN